MIQSLSNRTASLLLCTFVAVSFLVGCGPNGPESTDTDSSAFGNLAEKVEFLERHVSFDRSYDELAFSIRFFNGGAGFLSAPAPSEWDIRLVARVPEATLDEWAGTKSVDLPSEPLTWLDSVPSALSLTGIGEWYEDNGRVVGIDREQRIVVYRLFAN